MNTLLLAAQLLGLIATFALIWLVVRAFKKHLGWGFAVLLLSPFAATYFGIKYWQDEKVPFLAYISTFVTAIALGLYVFTAWGGWELVQASQRVQQGIQGEDLTDADAYAFMKAGLMFLENTKPGVEDQQKLETIGEELERQQSALSPETAVPDPVQQQKDYDLRSIARKVKPVQDRYRLVYVPIELTEARDYVGSTMKVTRKNVPEKEYRLTGAAGNNLEFSQRTKHGTFSFKFRLNDIEKIRVLTKQPT